MRIIIIIVSLLTTLDGFGQINPIGLMLRMNGSVQVLTDPPNYNGNVDNPVHVICGLDTAIHDLRNVRYDHLMIIEAPKYIYPNNLDPSYEEMISDTNSISSYDILYAGIDSNGTYLSTDSAVFNATSIQMFHDDIIGKGLINDSTIKLIKVKLSRFIQQNSGDFSDNENFQKLYYDLSTPDTDYDGEETYTYLIDKLIFYNYKDNRLTNIMGYHWNSGVEFDSLNYNSDGNLSYFLREEVGFGSEEVELSYDDESRVVGITLLSRLEGELTVTKFKFEYDINGLLSSKYFLSDDNDWVSCKFNLDL